MVCNAKALGAIQWLLANIIFAQRWAFVLSAHEFSGQATYAQAPTDDFSKFLEGSFTAMCSLPLEAMQASSNCPTERGGRCLVGFFLVAGS